MAKDLFARVSAAPSLASSFNISKLLAFILAAIVHLTTILLPVFGIVLIVGYWPNVFAIAGGSMALGTAWVLRPRFGKPPEKILPREEFPAMYQLVDNIASALGMKRIDGLVLTPDFNAAFSQTGLRRRSYIDIGLPLFSILSAEERVAILGHEVAHGVNGDVTRGWFIGGAINTLASWYYLLMPDEIFSSESGMPGVIMAPVNLLLAGLAKTAYGGAYVLLLLVMRDSQRAEYLADYLATTVSGTDAMLSALDKLHYSDTFTYATQRAALNRETGNIFTELPTLMATVPEREIERIRHIERMEGSRLDTSHPPTVYRRQLLEKRRVSEHSITLSDDESDRITGELERCYDEAHHRVVSEYLNQLYY